MKFPILSNEQAARTRSTRTRKPSWLKVKAAGGKRYQEIAKRLESLDLFTVCQEAH